ncbi:MAG: serine O-acetyltransferase EpsC [Ferruginibacter sp.]
MSSFKGYLLSSHFPSRHSVVKLTESLIHFIFPVIDDAKNYQKEEDQCSQSIRKLLIEILTPLSQHYPMDVPAVTEEFFEALPAIRQNLVKDAAFILEYDPAAYSIEEIVLSYPGFNAIIVYRLTHYLYQKKIPVLPRMMSEWAHSRTGIDINPGAVIGCPFFIDHGTGIVIGETAVIGKNVKIYQGVTLGALAVRKEDAQTKRHPSIEDNVVIYANSTILGGNTVIGHDSIIGGNTWVTQSVNAHSLVYTKSETIITDRKDFTEPINFII